jgi:hypothetical protein
VNVADDDGLATIETGPASQLAQSKLGESVRVELSVGVELSVELSFGGLFKPLVHQCICIQLTQHQCS